MTRSSRADKRWTRRKSTRKGVILSDVLSRFVITGGGVGTIIAVLGVCLFLVWVALPLFRSAELTEAHTFPAAWNAESRPLHFAIDEYQAMGWAFLADGRIQTFEISSGAKLLDQQVFTNNLLRCASFLVDGPECVFGFGDGTIRTARIQCKTTFLSDSSVPDEVRATLTGEEGNRAIPYKEGVIQRTPEGQFRWQRLQVELQNTAKLADEPVFAVDHVVRPDGQLICALVGEEGRASLKAIEGRMKESFLTGATTFSFGTPVLLPLEPMGKDIPNCVAVAAQGRDVYVGWEDGVINRVRFPGHGAPFLAEKGRLFADDAKLTAIQFLLGNNTLVWGDSKGRIRAGFLVRHHGPPLDGGLINAKRDTERAEFAFAITKSMADTGSPALSLASSSRSRIIASGHEDGSIALFNVTSEGELARWRVPNGEPVRGVRVAPKEDGLLAYTDSRLFHCHIDPRHPEANFAALFRPVWYEGYGRPQHMWQSSSASDDFEPKLGLVPLIFGTIKATLYSMLFGAPLALLAAIFSSEFLHPRVKGLVKPTVELMASLPSVVLGFLAALVFAPFMEDVVPATLLVFVLLPLSFVVAAYVWQLLPPRITLPLANWRPLFMLLPVVVGVSAAFALGPVVEKVLFAGDFKAWLSWMPNETGGGDPRIQGSVGGWMLLGLPLSIFVVAVVTGRLVNPYIRQLSRRLDRTALAAADFIKFLGAALSALVLAWLGSCVLNAWGLDPRGSYVATYVQRNSLVVGMVMGFAIIPIIYTIADDALSTVPDHLRGASLGAGATKWQTAVRVVIPTAMSGLFSAVMIGLGRAVGETMIVLMAAGNTPILKWNIFEGFRTLSANIAVELPEAVQGSTHYRILFLAALVLFVMTFIVNTIAEIVRLRFRKRAVSL